MNILIDTNVCIMLINESDAGVQRRFQEATRKGHTVYLSSIVFFELCYGVWKSSKPELNFQRLNAFVAGPLRSLPFEATDSEIAGRIRANLSASGQPIGDYDVLVAAQARARGMTLVTHNTREFSRIHGLVLEDWES